MNPKPKKQFGQHFLIDTQIIGRIVQAIAPKAGEVIIEIGPGPGALTAPLLLKHAHLHVVEIDRDLAASLVRRYPPEQLTVHETDVLEFDFSQINDGAKFRAVGNLPYNISTPFLFHLAQFSAQLTDAVFMLQKEVVDRMVAGPDDDAYGRLSVMLQYQFSLEALFDVPPDAFTPPPKVMSAIVRLQPLGDDRPRAKSDSHFAQVVATAFGQRRKMLRNTLKGIISEAELKALGIAPTARAETLSVAEFIAIADATYKE
jgi:16S rRNA (adenine1518-N6/adenine1519-N6)-dimethyltransferase